MGIYRTLGGISLVLSKWNSSDVLPKQELPYLLEAIFGGKYNMLQILWLPVWSLCGSGSVKWPAISERPNKMCRIIGMEITYFSLSLWCMLNLLSQSWRDALLLHCWHMVFIVSLHPPLLFLAYRKRNSPVRAKAPLEQLKINKLKIMQPFFPARNAGFLHKCIPLMMVHWQNLPEVRET